MGGRPYHFGRSKNHRADVLGAGEPLDNGAVDISTSGGEVG
jgi:hypothetical protein